MILDNTIIKEFEEAGAILHGHFVLRQAAQQHLHTMR